jgi:hypothetical protein
VSGPITLRNSSGEGRFITTVIPEIELTKYPVAESAAAPLPDAVMTTPSVAFLAEIRRVVPSAIEASGGEVRLSEAA